MKAMTLTTILSLSCFLAACGGSSDPLSKYSVKGEEPHSNSRERMTTIARNGFVIELASLDRSVALQNNFIENQDGQTLIKVTVNNPVITRYTLAISDFPQSPNVPTLNATRTPGFFNLAWKPHEGFLPPGTDGQAFNVKINAIVTEATDQQLVGTLYTGNITINVSRHNAVPVIVSFTNIESTGVTEGENKSFSVQVSDPSTTSTGRPHLVFREVPYNNVEAFCANFANRLIPANTNPVEKISDTVWKFNYMIDTTNLPLDRNRQGTETTDGSSVKACFFMRAVGHGGGASGEKKIEFTARYEVQEATIQWATETISIFQAGVESKIRFSLSTANALGVLTMPNLQRDLQVLSGSAKSLVCTNENGSTANKNCELSWKPSCVAAATEVKFKLEVLNTSGTRRRTKTFERQLTVEPSESCSRPAARPAAAASPRRESTQPRSPTLQPASSNAAAQPQVSRG